MKSMKKTGEWIYTITGGEVLSEEEYLFYFILFFYYYE